MKKIFALFLAFILCFSLCACGEQKGSETWSITKTVDEFGDITENSVNLITGSFTGTFSNTATPGSDLTVIVSIGKKAKFNHYFVGFDLKEYNNTNATYLSSDVKTFKMKINDEIHTMDLDGSSPNGTLYLSGKNYEWEGDRLFNELFKGNDVKCIINIGHSEYNFTLTSDNFISVCNENEYGEGITELTVREALNILLEDSGEYTEIAEECIESKIEEYEILSSADLKTHLDGYFLEVGPGHTYVGNGIYNTWKIYEISPEKQTLSLKAIYNMSVKLSMRTYSYSFKKEPTKITFENDLITKHYSKSDSSFSYQCRKISGNIFMMCILSEGEFKPSSLLFRINGDSIDKDVEYIQNNYLGEIRF